MESFTGYRQRQRKKQKKSLVSIFMRNKKICTYILVCVLAYLSTFIWGDTYPYKAAAVQVVSSAWLMCIAWANEWLRIDI